MYINGEWLKTDNIIQVKNPADNSVVGEVYTVGAKETKKAINAAKEAFPKWSALTGEQRGNYLQKIVDKLKEKKEHLAQVITKEMGKSIHNSRYEVNSAISYFQWYAEEARRVYGEVIPASDASKRISVIKQPIGVIGAITPWNFPLSMGARKLGPALAVGCTVVLRPSRTAPLSSLELFKIFDEVDLPKGVVNLVIGGSKEIVGELMESEIVRKISFTGSTEVGKLLIRQSADTVKRVSMELGGHAPYIIFEDADLEVAAEGALSSAFSSTGQQCVCANRVYVHNSVYDKFAEIFKSKVSSLIVGDGIDENTNVGALVNQEAINKVTEQVEDAKSKGATVIVGGEELQEDNFKKGFFYAPTVLGDVEDEMAITYEETFGPVAPLIRFNSEEEVVKRANDTKFGLASYLYTNDLSRAYRVSEQLEYGMVGINDAAPFAVQSPFGGVKESGQGREGGHYGLDDYLETKLISTSIITQK